MKQSSQQQQHDYTHTLTHTLHVDFYIISVLTKDLLVPCRIHQGAQNSRTVCGGIIGHFQFFFQKFTI